MLVKEIRLELSKYDRKELEEIIIELYKKVPKKVKESYCIDEYIKNKKELATKKEEKLSFDELISEIKWFISCVDKDYYCSPNNVISKQERQKWRFKVKKYYKELKSTDPISDDGKISTELLIELFKKLSYGNYILKFSNWQTFKAIGVSQTEFYFTIITKILLNTHNYENIYKCVNLLSVDKDMDIPPYIFV